MSGTLFGALSAVMLGLFWASSRFGLRALERRFAIAALPHLELLDREEQLQRWFHLSVLSALGGALAGMPAGGIGFSAAAGIAGSLLPLWYLMRAARRRVAQMERQLPSAVDGLAAALRSGQSMQQAVVWVGKEAPEPVASVFSRLAKELALGRSVEEGLQSAASRVPAPGLKTIAMTVGPLRQMGANLVPAFEGMADILRRRAATNEKLSSLAAQGKMQLWVMSLMLPALSLVVFSLEPALMARLFVDWRGNLFIILAVFLEALGVWLARRILDPDRIWDE